MGSASTICQLWRLCSTGRCTEDGKKTRLRNINGPVFIYVDFLEKRSEIWLRTETSFSLTGVQLGAAMGEQTGTIRRSNTDVCRCMRKFSTKEMKIQTRRKGPLSADRWSCVAPNAIAMPASIPDFLQIRAAGIEKISYPSPRISPSTFASVWYRSQRAALSSVSVTVGH